MTTSISSAEERRAHRRVITAGIAGNVMEWYDFSIYGFFARTIGQQFFPAHDLNVSLMAAFGTFAVGFFMRPLGAVLFGYIGDRSARKTIEPVYSPPTASPCRIRQSSISIEAMMPTS